MPANEEEILAIRNQIDSLDEQLVKLLKDRLKLALHLAQLKHKLQIPIEDRTREKDILDRVAKHADNPEIAKAIQDVYQSIFEVSRDIQKKLHKSRSGTCVIR